MDLDWKIKMSLSTKQFKTGALLARGKKKSVKKNDPYLIFLMYRVMQFSLLLFIYLFSPHPHNPETLTKNKTL